MTIAATERALAAALTAGDADSAHELLARGAPARALFLAAVAGCGPATIAAMAAAGADPHALDAAGRDAYRAALDAGRNGGFAAIDEAGHRAGEHAGPALRLAVYRGEDAAARALLRLGADPDYAEGDAEFPEGHGPLAVAARVRDRAAVEALLEAGADPLREDAEGMRPYLFAVERGAAEMAESLREAEPYFLHDPEELLDALAPYALPETLRGFLSAADPLMRPGGPRGPRGVAVAGPARYIAYFTLLDAAPVRREGAALLRLSRVVDGRATRVLWDAGSRRVLALEPAGGADPAGPAGPPAPDAPAERISVLGSWPEFFARPFELLAAHERGELPRWRVGTPRSGGA